MKSTRKGFTLVELLIVIVIIGILSAMMLVSGTEAQNAAKVTKITEGFRSLTAALMMYYNEDPTSAVQVTDAKTIVDGAKKYVKNDAVFDTAPKTTTGTYYVDIKNGKWWLSYKLPGTSGALNDLLAKKADDLALKKSSEAEEGKTIEPYDGGADVYMNVR